MSTRVNASAAPTRRALLQTGLACGLLPCPAGFLNTRTDAEDRMLVLLHLSGGNDGLNTVIPHDDALYHELRPNLGRVARSALRIDSQTAFHPALAGLARLFDRGQLAVVQGVGYPDPDYSHRGSCAIWAAGGHNAEVAGNWWDRVFEQQAQGVAPLAVSVGERALTPLVGPHRVRHAGSGKIAFKPGPLEYASGQIERTLAGVGRVLQSACPPRLVMATLGGFDTHSDQLARHEQVLRELDRSLTALLAELAAADLGSRVLIVAWSEFGRRPAENATGGTDHGTAGPVFVLGQGVHGGFYGTAPSLEVTAFGNLIPTVHLRSIYEAVATRWLGWRGDSNSGSMLRNLV